MFECVHVRKLMGSFIADPGVSFGFVRSMGETARLARRRTVEFFQAMPEAPPEGSPVVVAVNSGIVESW